MVAAGHKCAEGVGEPRSALLVYLSLEWHLPLVIAFASRSLHTFVNSFQEPLPGIHPLQ